MAIPNALEKTIAAMAERLQGLPTHWDGKGAILELKAADYQWRQMEWIGFYFEYKAKQALAEICTVPGDKINKTVFDLKKDINFDLKANAIQSQSCIVILNDKEAMELSINAHGFHGEIIAIVDVEYDDEGGTFKKWHSEVKDNRSEYEQKGIAEGRKSRKRKTKATLMEIIFVILGTEDLDKLHIMKQGKNSNGQPRPLKYGLNLKKLVKFRHTTVEF